MKDKKKKGLQPKRGYTAAASSTGVDPQLNMPRNMKDFYRSSTFKGLTKEEQKLLRTWTGTYGLTLPDRITGDPGFSSKALMALKWGLDSYHRVYDSKTVEGYSSRRQSRGLLGIERPLVNYPSEIVLMSDRIEGEDTLAHELGHYYQDEYPKIKDKNKTITSIDPISNKKHVVTGRESQADAIQEAITGGYQSNNLYSDVRRSKGVSLDTAPSAKRFSGHRLQVALDAANPPGMDLPGEGIENTNMHKKIAKKSLGGLLKKALPIAGAVGGAFLGNPMLGYQLGSAASSLVPGDPAAQQGPQVPQMRQDLMDPQQYLGQFMKYGGAIKTMARGGKLRAIKGGFKVGGEAHSAGGTVIQKELGLEEPVEMEKGETVGFISSGRGVTQTNSAGGRQPFVFSKQLKVSDPNSPYNGLSYAKAFEMEAKNGGDGSALAEQQEAQKSPQRMGLGGFLQNQDWGNIAEGVADFAPGIAQLAGSYLAPKPKLQTRTMVNTSKALQPLGAMKTRLDYRPAFAENRAATRGVLGNRAATSQDIQMAHSRTQMNVGALVADKANKEAALINDQRKLQSGVLEAGALAQAGIDDRVQAANTGILNNDQDARTAMRIGAVGSLAQGVYNRQGRRREKEWMKQVDDVLAQQKVEPIEDAGGESSSAQRYSPDNYVAAPGRPEPFRNKVATLPTNPNSRAKATNTRPTTDPNAPPVTPRMKGQGLKVGETIRLDTKAGPAPSVDKEGFYNAVQSAESNNDPNAVSPVGATGLMQVMPDTAMQPGFGMSNIFSFAMRAGMKVGSRTEAEAKRLLKDPKLGAAFGREYLDKMTLKYGNRNHALAAYNWGPTRVDAWIKQGADFNKLPKATQKYINGINASLAP